MTGERWPVGAEEVQNLIAEGELDLVEPRRSTQRCS